MPKYKVLIPIYDGQRLVPAGEIIDAEGGIDTHMELIAPVAPAKSGKKGAQAGVKADPTSTDGEPEAETPADSAE